MHIDRQNNFTFVTVMFRIETLDGSIYDHSFELSMHLLNQGLQSWVRKTNCHHDLQNQIQI